MFSERLKSFREKSNLTQAQIAVLLNIDRSTYSYYELGRTRPDIDTIVKLAKIFKVSVDDLLEYNSQNAKAPRVFNAATGKYEKSFESVYLPDLDKDEQNLILIYRQVSQESKEDMVKSAKQKLLQEL